MPRQFFPLDQKILDGIERKYLDVPYCGDSPFQILDLYYPNEGEKPYPVIVHLHGGAFANGNQRESHLEPILRGLGRGYAVASVQYRRSGEALFPAQVWDAKAAIRFLRANGERYELDPARFASWGASSGGWLASMVGVTAGNPAFENPDQGNGEYSAAVQAVVDWCGPCGGFLEMDAAFRKSGLGQADHNEAGSPESRFLGRAITEIPELVRVACPCTYVDGNTPPVILIHGGADQIVPVEQSVRFYETIVQRCGQERARLHIAEGKLHHGDSWYLEPWVTDTCLDYLDHVLRR